MGIGVAALNVLSISFMIFQGIFPLIFCSECTMFLTGCLPVSVILTAWGLYFKHDPHLVVFTPSVCRHWILSIPLELLMWWGLWRFHRAFVCKVLFDRDPDRNIRPDPNALMCPADGRVMYIKPVKDGVVPMAVKERKEILLTEIMAMNRETGAALPKTDWILVGIFMNPYSVHVQRSPITGIVRKIFYKRAQFNRTMGGILKRALWLKKKDLYAPEVAGYLTQNERLTALFEKEGQPDETPLRVFVTQIADAEVNKIMISKNIGDAISQGDRYGTIRFGSQVDMLFPVTVGTEKIEPCVKVGDYVYAGETVLARITH